MAKSLGGYEMEGTLPSEERDCGCHLSLIADLAQDLVLKVASLEPMGSLQAGRMPLHLALRTISRPLPHRPCFAPSSSAFACLEYV